MGDRPRWSAAAALSPAAVQLRSVPPAGPAGPTAPARSRPSRPASSSTASRSNCSPSNRPKVSAALASASRSLRTATAVAASRSEGWPLRPRSLPNSRQGHFRRGTRRPRPGSRVTASASRLSTPRSHERATSQLLPEPGSPSTSPSTCSRLRPAGKDLVKIADRLAPRRTGPVRRCRAGAPGPHSLRRQGRPDLRGRPGLPAGA